MTLTSEEVEAAIKAANRMRENVGDIWVDFIDGGTRYFDLKVLSRRG